MYHNFSRNRIYFAVCFLFVFTLNSSVLFAQDSIKETSETTSEKSLKEILKQKQDSVDFLLFEGKYNEVITRSIDNIALAERIGDSGAAYYSRYIIAATHVYLEEFDTSLRYLAPYKKYAEKNNDTLRMGRAYNLEGVIYVSEEKYAQSIPLFKKSLPLFKGLKDTLQTTIAYHNMTESYVKQDDYENARIYFDSTTVSLKSMKGFNGLTTEYNLLAGRIKMKDENYSGAVKNFEKSIAFGERTGYVDSYVVEAYKRYSEALYAMGDTSEAYLAYSKYDSINKVLFEKDKVKIIQNATAKFDTEQYKAAAKQADLENKLNEERLSNQKYITWFAVLLGLVVLILLIMLFFNKKKQKNNITV